MLAAAATSAASSAASSAVEHFLLCVDGISKKNSTDIQSIGNLFLSVYLYLDEHPDDRDGVGEEYMPKMLAIVKEASDILNDIKFVQGQKKTFMSWDCMSMPSMTHVTCTSGFFGVTPRLSEKERSDLLKVEFTEAAMNMFKNISGAPGFVKLYSVKKFSDDACASYVHERMQEKAVKGYRDEAVKKFENMVKNSQLQRHMRLIVHLRGHGAQTSSISSKICARIKEYEIVKVLAQLVGDALSLAEFEELLGKYLEALQNMFDVNGDGNINLNEVLFVLQFVAPIAKRAITEFFEAVDHDGDGEIKRCELREFLAALWLHQHGLSASACALAVQIQDGPSGFSLKGEIFDSSFTAGQGHQKVKILFKLEEADIAAELCKVVEAMPDPPDVQHFEAFREYLLLRKVSSPPALMALKLPGTGGSHHFTKSDGRKALMAFYSNLPDGDKVKTLANLPASLQDKIVNRLTPDNLFNPFWLRGRPNLQVAMFSQFDHPDMVSELARAKPSLAASFKIIDAHAMTAYFVSFPDPERVDFLMSVPDSLQQKCLERLRQGQTDHGH